MDSKKLKKMLMRCPTLLRHLQYWHDVVTRPNRIMQRKSYGNNNTGKTIFVIRPNAEDGIQGLMSLFIQTLRWVEYSNRNNYIPYVDFKNYNTQYYDGTHNAWELFFKQLSTISEEEVYTSHRVILSGTSLRKTVDYKSLRKEIFFDNNEAKKYHKIVSESIAFSDDVIRVVEEESRRLDIENSIGLYLRGTDYIALKPAGEYVQPNMEQVSVVVDKFLSKYTGRNLFLVTEDGNYYRILKERYGDLIKLTSYDSFITNYDGKDYLSRSDVLNNDKRKRGIDYLAKIVLLSRCKYLISSITMGSIAAYVLNGGSYDEKYIFDLGLYK